MVSHFRHPDLLPYFIHHQFPLTIKYWSSVRQYDKTFVSDYWNVQGVYNLYKNIPQLSKIIVFWNVMSDRYSTVPKFLNLKVFDVSLATHFNTTVLTFCNWFQQIRMRPCGRRFGFPNSSMIVQTTIRSVRCFIMSSWLLSCFMEWDSILAISCTLCFQKVCAFYYKSTLMLFKVTWYLQYCYLTCCWKETGILYCK